MPSALATVQILAVATLVLAAGALAIAAFRPAARTAIVALTTLVAAGLLAAAIVVALNPERDILLTSLATVGAFLGCCGALGLARGMTHARRTTQEIDRARLELRLILDEEIGRQKPELERAMKLARAEAAALLTQQEREAAEARRLAIAEAEQQASAALGGSLIEIQRQVEERVSAWRSDLERAQGILDEHLTRLGERQKSLLVETEKRLQADSDRLAAESSEYRNAIVRLREELEQAVGKASTAIGAEIDAQMNERRRALTELTQRLKQREQEISDQIAREELDAKRRVQAGAAEIEKKQLEKLERAVERAAARFSEATGRQIEEAMLKARDEAARRFGRELDRAIENFSQQATTLMSSRLASGAAHEPVERR